jgi:hypothetical protein
MSAREELSNVMDIEYTHKSLLWTIFKNRRLRDESEQRIRGVRSCFIQVLVQLDLHMDTAVFTSSGRHVVRNRGGRSDDNERYRVQVTTTA